MPLRTVRILCFGDSLTEGYTSFGNMFHPYAHTMMKTLRLAFPEVKLDISVKGEAGDYVDPRRGDFHERLREELATAIDRQERYNWVLILGGTNDLASPATDPEELFSNLEKLYEMCFSKGAKVIAMTIPECHAKLDWLNEHRNAVNDMIRNYPRDDYYVFDLYNSIPYAKLTTYERHQIWDDGLHMTTIGYSKMGLKVADFFLPLLRAHIDAMPRDPPSPLPPSQNQVIGEQSNTEDAPTPATPTTSTAAPNTTSAAAAIA